MPEKQADLLISLYFRLDPTFFYQINSNFN